MTVKERLKFRLKREDIDRLDFCKRIGVSPGYINSMRSSISPKVLRRIVMKFPELDIVYLLTGLMLPISNVEIERTKRMTYLYESYLNLDELFKEIKDKDEKIKQQDLLIKSLKKEIDKLKER